MGAARRRFGFLIAIGVAALPLLAQPLSAAASSTGTLYSVSASGYLVQLDQAAGTQTPVVNLAPTGLPFGVYPIPGGFASDSIGHRLFGLLRTQDIRTFPGSWTHQVLTITPGGPTVSTSGDLSRLLQSSLAFDSSNNSLYGITECCPSELVQINPVTGDELTLTQLSSDMTDTFSEIAIDPATHTFYVARSSHSTYPPPTELLAINLATPAASAPPVALQRGVVGLAFDTSSHALFGVTFCCGDSFILKIESTGDESTIAEITNTLLLGSTATIDSATHTIYLINSTFDFQTGPATFITSVDDRGGVAPVNGASTPDFLTSLGFLGAAITPDSIRADVRSALAGGAIDSAGVANALLAQLNAAAAARTAGQCPTAASIYQAFVNAVNAQSGKHVAASTATKLASEAQFLAANCP
jgi:hypothetical protein